MVGGSSSGRRLFKKEKKNKKNKKKMQSARASKPSQIKKFKSDQSQTECFYYRKQRHWKKNYPQYIASLDSNRLRKKQAIAGQDNYMIISYNFSIYESTIWVLDIESLFNICNSLQVL